MDKTLQLWTPEGCNSISVLCTSCPAVGVNGNVHYVSMVLSLSCGRSYEASEIHCIIEVWRLLRIRLG